MLWYLSEWIFAIKFNRVKNLAAKYNKHLSLYDLYDNDLSN